MGLFSSYSVFFGGAMMISSSDSIVEIFEEAVSEFLPVFIFQFL